MKAVKFVFITLFSLFSVLYLLIVFYVYFNQVDMIFQSQKLNKKYKFNYTSNFEEINIKSFDNTILNGLLFKAKNSKGLIFYLHGNAGNLASWGNIASIYTNLGYDIFILDYRSFGKSEGEIENENQFNQDISACYKKMLLRYKEENIIIEGYSIGSGPATILAFKYNPKALILQAPYYNFLELSSGRVPFVPDFIKKFTFETNIFIPKIKAPIYVFHGDIDQVIPFENSIRLKKLLKTTDHFFPLENQDHIGINENHFFQKQLQLILEK